jgi:DNA helicase-2/ATP-dependent DNA helicase PcrA
MIEPIIFLGPPGTGKTTALLEAVDQEMNNGVPPDRIGFMTFTKRGVEEAVNRAVEKFMLSRKDLRYFNTLHSAAFRHLGLNTDRVFTGKRIYEFGLEHGLELRGSQSVDDGTYSSFFGDDIILFLENYARITCQPLEKVLQDYAYVLPDSERARIVVRTMLDHKEKHGLLDFTDMIEQFVREDNPPRLEVLFIDEAQDLSTLQWNMVELLARYVKRLYVAGDDDQTIFTWAGASERFITMPGQVRLLQQSYRVPAVVHALANRMVSQIINRRPKDWYPRDAEGSHNIIEGISQLDPDFINGGSTMMLGRTVKLLKKKFVPYCRYHGIFYKYFEANSIKQSYATAIEAWSELRLGKRIPADQIVSIYELLPSDGHGKPGIKRGSKVQLYRIAEQPEPPYLNMSDLVKDYGLVAQGDWEDVFVMIPVEDIAYIKKVLRNGHNIVGKPKVHISTIHRVKGGQADKVILLSDTTKGTERLSASNSDEETRVFYTGITRTYEDLVIVRPDKKYYFGGLE